MSENGAKNINLDYNTGYSNNIHSIVSRYKKTFFNPHMEYGPWNCRKFHPGLG